MPPRGWLVTPQSGSLPFVAAPVGDIAAAFEAARRAAEQWGLDEPRFLRAGMNALFSCGEEVVLRVGRVTADPGAASWLAAHLVAAGLRVPRPLGLPALRCGELTVLAQVRERSVGAVDWVEIGAMVARLHRLDAEEIRAHHPLPRGLGFPWWDFPRLLAEVDDLLDPQSRTALRRAVDVHGSWPSLGVAEVVCHGDVHPGNVMQTDDGAVLLDWDLLCLAPPAWDHAPLMSWAERWGGEPGVYARFAEGYGRSLRADDLAESLALLRLVAATLMRLRAGRSDPGAAAEAALRLRWWRGDPEAPMWTAQ